MSRDLGILGYRPHGLEKVTKRNKISQSKTEERKNCKYQESKRKTKECKQFSGLPGLEIRRKQGPWNMLPLIADILQMEKNNLDDAQDVQ